MTQRRLDLHASALNDAEYELYTTSLADITLADEGNDNHDGTDKDKKGTEHDDAYYDRLTVSVREARAWLRGRYSHVTAVTIDNILKYFSPSLSQTDTLTGGQFFAALRLVVHAESGKEVDRTLAFVQAHPIKTSTSCPASPPPKRPIPPAPISRKSLDGTHNNPFAAATSPSSQTQSPPPQHPSATNNPFSYTTRSKSTPAAPKTHDGAFDSAPSKLPPLPPRKPPPPVPSSSSAPLQPPPRHNSLLPGTNATVSLISSKTAPLPSTSSPVTSPFGSPFGNSNGTPPPLPPKATLGHVAHVTSTLMKQSLQASKTGSAMKKAEEQLEKERVLSVLKSSAGSSRPSPFANTTHSNHSSTSIVANARNRSVSPNKWEGSSASSCTSGEDVEKREPPPLPSRKKKPSPPQSVSAISASSFQSVALAQASASQGGIGMVKRTPSVKSSRSNPFDVYRSTSRPTSRSPSVSPTRDGRQRELPPTPPPRHPDQSSNTVTASTYTQRKPPPPIPAGLLASTSSSSTSSASSTTSNPPSAIGSGMPTSPFGGNSGLATPFSSPSTTMSGAKSASPYVSAFAERGDRTPTALDRARPSVLDLGSPFGDPTGTGPGSSSPSTSMFSTNSSPKDDSPTTRLFRSKSLHHPTSTAGSSYLRDKSPFFDENDGEREEPSVFEDFQTPDATPTHTPTPTPPRRKRPESMQVLGVGYGGSGSNWGGPLNSSLGGRHMSLVSTPSPPTASVIPLRQQLMHRRMTSNGSVSVGSGLSSVQDESSSATATGSSGTSPFKTIATSLGPQLEALQPKLDKARYKAEAGLSKRGFVREGLHGLNGMHGMPGEREERERRREERAGLMDDKGRREQSLDSDSESDEGYDDEERFRIRGLRRGPSSHSQSSSHSKSRTGSSTEPRFGTVEYGSGSGSSSGGLRGIEKDNLKWPVAEGEGWRPL